MDGTIYILTTPLTAYSGHPSGSGARAAAAGLEPHSWWPGQPGSVSGWRPEGVSVEYLNGWWLAVDEKDLNWRVLDVISGEGVLVPPFETRSHCTRNFTPKCERTGGLQHTC